MTPQTASAAIKQRVFSDYQRMLTFTINLCYQGKDYKILRTSSGYAVRYW